VRRAGIIVKARSTGWPMPNPALSVSSAPWS
jgi:hypothetical protein